MSHAAELIIFSKGLRLDDVMQRRWSRHRKQEAAKGELGRHWS
jgi:hypothetical protein